MAVYSTWNPRYIRRTPGWTPRRSYYGPRYIRSRTSRRKANAEARAARQQRDTATVTINRIATIQVTVPIGDANAATTVNHWNQLRLSSFFPNYAPMYDQMKLDKIRVKITGFRAGTAQTANISPSVVLAFDRNGLNEGQNVTTSTISTYSSAQLKQWSTGNAFAMYQTIYPSTIMEKGQYVPTDSLEDPESESAVDNPCIDESSAVLPFKPLTLIGVDLGAAQQAAQTFAFTAEYEYTVTFRGMRKPSLSSSPVLDLVPFADTLIRNGRYTVTAEEAGVDGWDSVDILVNVPPPDSKFDGLSVYTSSGSSYNLVGTYTIQDLSLTTATGYAVISIPRNYLFFHVHRDGQQVGNNTVGTVAFVYNPTTNTPNYEVYTNDCYALIPMTLTGDSGYISLNVGSDPVVYSFFYVSYADYRFIYADYEDLDLFLNQGE